MTKQEIPVGIRTNELFHHIDMGFINRRLCMTAIPKEVRNDLINRMQPETNHMAVLGNDHLLVTVLLDVCDAVKAPTLIEALEEGLPKQLFRSTECLAPCPDLYNAERVEHEVELDINFGKPVILAYHTEHLVSSTGKMVLHRGSKGHHTESIVGVLHNKPDRFEIEPLVMGAPWFDHPRNKKYKLDLMWIGRDYGEILPEDIDQFKEMKTVLVDSADEWMNVMKKLPEADIKLAFAKLLNEPTKKDWGGETNDHFSANVSVNGHRKTAAFLLKGPTLFREMTLDMCGKRADQIFRLTKSGADISIIQHSHLIGEVVRATLKSMTVFPGQSRKYCLIDGQTTYRILKAYALLPH